jgi:hypothetical protein
MNDIFDNFNRFITGVNKVAAQLLGNESSYDCHDYFIYTA